MGKQLVSERALLKRFNRVLVKSGLQLHKSRHGFMNCDSCVLELGDYYSTDYFFDQVTQTHIELEKEARLQGILKSNEQLSRQKN